MTRCQHFVRQRSLTREIVVVETTLAGWFLSEFYIFMNSGIIYGQQLFNNVQKCTHMYMIKSEFIPKITPPESIVSASFGNNLFCSCFFRIFLESVRFEEEPLSELHSFTFDPCLKKGLRVGTQKKFAWPTMNSLFWRAKSLTTQTVKSVIWKS